MQYDKLFVYYIIFAFISQMVYLGTHAVRMKKMHVTVF